jgi:hypothetical protein
MLRNGRESQAVGGCCKPLRPRSKALLPKRRRRVEISRPESNARELQFFMPFALFGATLQSDTRRSYMSFQGSSGLRTPRLAAATFQSNFDPLGEFTHQ